MSRARIDHYRRTLAEQHRVTGSLNERVPWNAFAELIERTGRIPQGTWDYLVGNRSVID
jgi:hypothetical protein